MPEPITLVTVPQFERNLFHHVDADKSFQVTVRNLDGVTLTNITGWAVSFVVHAYSNPNITYFTKTVGSGVTISNGLAGLLTVAIEDGDVTSVPPGLYQWRLERTDAGSEFVIGIGSYSLLAK